MCVVCVCACMPYSHPPCIVTKFAQERVAPLVQEMDEKEELDQSIIKGLFEQGVSVPCFNTVQRDVYVLLKPCS